MGFRTALDRVGKLLLLSLTDALRNRILLWE